jgi:predicted DNA-binding transcriptional regulator AlpA
LLRCGMDGRRLFVAAIPLPWTLLHALCLHRCELFTRGKVMLNRLPYPPPYQDLATLALHICAGESTIENWVKMGLFPTPKKIGGKRLWCWKEVERYLADNNSDVPSYADDLTTRITNATRRAAQGH